MTSQSTQAEEWRKLADQLHLSKVREVVSVVCSIDDGSSTVEGENKETGSSQEGSLPPTQGNKILVCLRSEKVRTY
ncbi:hypothetical protein HK102_000935, partial [Quaeritorhiza haematococci]